MKALTVKLPAVFLAALVISGCALTIPDTDTQLPEIRLAITGPVIGRQEMTNPPRDNWTAPDGTQLFDLARNTVYSFVLTVTDQGGAARAHLRMPADFTIVSLTPSEATNTTSGLTRTLSLRGTRAAPRTVLIISGRLRTPDAGPTGFTFHAEADDFGGASGRPNQRFMDVQASVGSR